MISGGKMEPYSKRCTATKLTSAEKLMYICKNQLGKLLISFSIKFKIVKGNTTVGVFWNLQ